MTLTPARLQNLLIYCGVGLLNMLAIATAAALQSGAMPGFRDGEFMAPAKGEAIALLVLLMPILSGWVAAHQPSYGGENLAAQASVLRQQGYHRDEMVVLSPDDAVATIAGAQQPLTPAQTAQIVAAMKAELLRDPEGDEPPPVDPASVPDHIIGLVDRAERGRG